MNEEQKAKAVERTRKWRLNNPDKLRELRKNHKKRRRALDNPHRAEDDRKARERVKRWREKNPDGWQKWRAANEEHRRDWGREHSLEYKLRTKFKMTMADREKHIKAQGGVCAICHLPELQPNKRLSLDHDHQTNQFRGFLCHNCNVALGLFKDDPERFRAAANYLELHAAVDAA